MLVGAFVLICLHYIKPTFFQDMCVERQICAWRKKKQVERKQSHDIDW